MGAGQSDEGSDSEVEDEEGDEVEERIPGERKRLSEKKTSEAEIDKAADAVAKVEGGGGGGTGEGKVPNKPAVEVGLANAEDPEKNSHKGWDLVDGRGSNAVSYSVELSDKVEDNGGSSTSLASSVSRDGLDPQNGAVSDSVITVVAAKEMMYFAQANGVQPQNGQQKSRSSHDVLLEEKQTASTFSSTMTVGRLVSEQGEADTSITSPHLNLGTVSPSPPDLNGTRQKEDLVGKPSTEEKAKQEPPKLEEEVSAQQVSFSAAVVAKCLRFPFLCDEGGTDIATDFFIIRHGEATNNLLTAIGGRSPSALLTAQGRKQAEMLGSFLRDYVHVRFDGVFCSTLLRAKETAELLCKGVGFPEKDIVYTEALQELSQGEWEGYERRMVWTKETTPRITSCQPDFRFPGGESQRQVEFRMIEFVNAVIRGEHPTSAKPGVEKNGIIARGQEGEGKASSTQQLVPGVLYTGGLHGQQQQQQQEAEEEAVVDGGEDEVPSAVAGRRSRHPRKMAIVSHGTAIKCLLRGLLASDPHFTHNIHIDNTSVTVLRFSPSRGWQLVRLNDSAHLWLLQHQGRPPAAAVAAPN